VAVRSSVTAHSENLEVAWASSRLWGLFDTSAHLFVSAMPHLGQSFVRMHSFVSSQTQVPSYPINLVPGFAAHSTSFLAKKRIGILNSGRIGATLLPFNLFPWWNMVHIHYGLYWTLAWSLWGPLFANLTESNGRADIYINSRICINKAHHHNLDFE
jgi:hypothetical protein